MAAAQHQREALTARLAEAEARASGGAASAEAVTAELHEARRALAEAEGKLREVGPPHAARGAGRRAWGGSKRNFKSRFKSLLEQLLKRYF